MSDSARKAAANEVVFRAVNEEIETLERSRAPEGERTMRIVCECAESSCTEMLTVPIGDYEQIRDDASLFIVKQGHEKIDLEYIVDEEADYRVVRKRAGVGERIAERNDPRSS